MSFAFKTDEFRSRWVGSRPRTSSRHATRQVTGRLIWCASLYSKWWILYQQWWISHVKHDEFRIKTEEFGASRLSSRSSSGGKVRIFIEKSWFSLKNLDFRIENDGFCVEKWWILTGSPEAERAQIMVAISSKMMHSVFKLMNFVFKMMSFVFKLMNFVFKLMNSNA